MSCERRGRRRPAGRRGPSALFMAHRCAARESTPASGHSQSLSPPKPVTGNAARRGGERVCGLVPVRATRPARGGATGSGCTEPNHGARWGVRAGRLVRRFAGGCTIGRKKRCAHLSRGAHAYVRYGYTQDPLLFSSLSGREEPNEQRWTIPGDVPNDPPGSLAPWVATKFQKLPAPRRPSGASAWVTQVSNP